MTLRSSINGFGRTTLERSCWATLVTILCALPFLVATSTALAQCPSPLVVPGVTATSGEVVLAPLPASLLDDASVCTTAWRVMLERRLESGSVPACADFTVPGTYTVQPPSSCTANVATEGQRFSSYLLHLDPGQIAGDLRRAGSVTFDGDIVAVMAGGFALNSTDAAFGATGMAYPTDTRREVEFEGQGTFVTISSNRRTLSFDSRVDNSFLDQVRVITIAQAQCSPEWLAGAGVPGVGGYFFAGEVKAMSLWDPDGPGPLGTRVAIGGRFPVAGHTLANSITALDLTTGSLSALGSGVLGTGQGVNAFAALPNGDLVVGGRFTSAGGVPASNIALYSSATGLWSALGSGVSAVGFSAVNAVTVLPGGDVVVGGQFTTAGGVPASNIALYSSATGLWSALGSGVRANGFSAVNAVTVLPGGDVVVGGQFTTAGGFATQGLARYTPATGAWSTFGSGITGGNPNAIIFALAVLPLGDLIVGGSFTGVSGVAASNIARYSTGGSWSSIGGGILNGNDPSSASVAALAALSNGEVVAGGTFTTAGGVSANNIARYSFVTGDWTALGSGTDRNVFAIAALPGGDLLAGGALLAAGGIPAKSISRYSPATGVWSALAAGTDNYVQALAVVPGGGVIAGGVFTTAGGTLATNIARLNPATGAWSSLGLGTNNSSVLAVAVLPGGDVIAGGGFTTAGGVAANHIARYAPTTGAWTALGSGTGGGGFGGTVSALAVLPGGDLIAGGDFAVAGGIPANGVARYSLSTGAWSSLGSGLARTAFNLLNVQAIAVLPGGDVIVGGLFAGAGGIPVTGGIARFSPTTGLWSAVGDLATGSFFDVPVRALTVLPGGDVIVGGMFTDAGGVSASNIARYSSSTGMWTALGTGTNNTVYALAALPGGDVIVGGAFTIAGGVPANRIARYSPATGLWSAMGSGTADVVFSLAVLAEDDLVAGGAFVIAGGKVSAYFARWALACVVDFNHSCSVSVQDIFDFLAAYFSSDPRADFNNSGTISVQDIFDFLAAYFAGCA